MTNSTRSFIDGVLDDFKDAIESANQELNEDRAMQAINDAFVHATDELEGFMEDQLAEAIKEEE